MSKNTKLSKTVSHSKDALTRTRRVGVRFTQKLFIWYMQVAKYLSPYIFRASSRIKILSFACFRFMSAYGRLGFCHLTKYIKFAHYHIAGKPHQYLCAKWKWYDNWHNNRHHTRTHYAAALSCLVVALGLMLMQYNLVHALSDLFDTWDFSNPSEYSASSGIDLPGTGANLKEQEYATDGNTAALYHFNETSGSSFADSSGNNNNGTVANGAFVSGTMKNSLSLDGATSNATVPSSPSLSLSQQNTIEAWTKFNSAFSKTTSAQRQGIVDKGDYQLYFDNETGKVTYELADKNASGWTLAAGNDANGSWNTNGRRSVNAITKMGSDIYVGIGIDVGDASVWKWNGSSWTMVGGGATSVNDSWDGNTYEGVYSLATDGTNLYAGLGSGTGDGEVWSWNGSTWSKIGGDSLNNGWTTNFEMVASLADDGSKLYAGLGLSANDAEVWSWNGSTWSQIGGDSLNNGWTTNYERVNSLKFFGGTLYAGLGDSANDAEVWSWNGSTWSQIGGDSLNNGWTTNYEQVTAFAWDGSNLYAGLGNSNGDGETWMWNGSTWSKIGGDSLNNGWTVNEGDIVQSMLFDGGHLYAGLYDASGGGTFWSFDGTDWSQLGGSYINKSWGFYGAQMVQVMQNVGDYLYAGSGGIAGAAQVWRFDGTSWVLIGGQGVNGSWSPNKFEQVISMANYKGNLYVGLGISANDAELWEWDGSSWTQVAGNTIPGSWGANYEEVDSLAADSDYLYAGLGNSSSDADVWRYNGSTWSKIGGDNTNSGWATGYYNVYSLAFYEGKLYAGLGRTTGSAEIWQWSGSTWAKVGGDGVGSSWGTTTYQEVDSLMPYRGKLYAGLGNVAGSGTLWQWDGTTWAQIGGDDINGSWTGGTYERVKTLAVYNGDLYAGLGSSAGDGEVWRLSNGVWTKIGGASMNGGWTNSIEEIDSMSAYRGKFYVGTGISTNLDNNIWSWGNNSFLRSNTDNFDTNWHHVAATYDGTTMKIYIDGTLDASMVTAVSLPTSGRDLLVGNTYGGREYGKAVGTLNGIIDELRISNTARLTLTSKPFLATAQTVRPNDASRKGGVWHWDAFAANEGGGGTVKYRLSDDEGTTWKYWNGSSWATSAVLSDSNTPTDISANISSFPVTFKGLLWQAILQGNGTEKVTINNVSLDSTSDIELPSSSTVNISAHKNQGGPVLTPGSWTNGTSPSFSWTAGTDSKSGVKGYCLYLGADQTADPVTTKGLLGVSGNDDGGHCQFMVTATTADLATAGYVGTPLTSSNSSYYLIVKTIDNAGNVSTDKASFSFKFDNTAPTNPGYISAPSGFVNNKAVTLTWPTTGGDAPSDANSGLAGLQYRIGPSGTWYGYNHTGLGDQNDLLPNNGSYTMQDPPDFANLVDGINTVYFRAFDASGNITPTYVTAAIKLNTSGAPSEPQNLTATPPVNTVNTFNFQWDPPATFVGDVGNISYCYTVNVQPDSTNCNYTGRGITALASGPYATKPGLNTIYVVAKDESSNINYSSFATTTFTANTSAPGMPLNTDIVDVSIRSTNNWRLALTWDVPSDVGAGVAKYIVYRSQDNTTFTQVGTSTSTTYIDAGLSQVRYYYRVTACDNTNNCGAMGTSVSAIPTGRFTEPADLVAPPTVSSVTTKKATISWSTDRNSDSKIALGTNSGQYGSSEIANSAQVSAHTIKLDNLAAGTTYYFVAKWTDEDGNTGTSQEYTFTTMPPPSLQEIAATNVGLSRATIQFTSKDASRVDVYFGPSSSFGGVQTVNTATAQSTYTVNLDNLNDGTKYFYKLVSYDSEGTAYDSSTQSFTTPQRPRITNLRFQPVAGKPTSTQEVTWQTNVAATSSLTYGIVGTRGSDVQDSTMTTNHSMIISNLTDDSEYFLYARSIDASGNIATSDQQVFHTDLDTRPPVISNINVEASIRGTGSEARGQVVVSWHTDEPATSQVAYGEGSGVIVFNTKTAEDTGLSFEHIVIVSDLPTSKVYSLQPISTDKAHNEEKGKTQSAIVGRASEDVLTIVLNSLRRIFGF